MKDYFLKHRALSERDLDELVTKSSMSYEQVRDWFSRTSKRADEGKELFSEEDVEAAAAAEGGEEEEEQQDQQEQQASQQECEALSQSQAEEQT